MLERILELDAQTKREVEKLNKMRLDSEQKLSIFKEEKKRSELKKAEDEIAEKKRLEKVRTFVKLTAIEGEYSKQRQEIEDLYAKNKNIWISDIIKRATDNIGE